MLSLLFTRTTLFTNCLHVCMIRIMSPCLAIMSPCFVTLHLPVSELNVLPEVIYCGFTRTTLFTTMFTVTIVVCSLKSMCIPNFAVV